MPDEVILSIDASVAQLQGAGLFLPLVLQFALIMLNALFACAEIAVISFNENKLAKLAASGDKRAIRLAKLTQEPARFLSVIQVGITLAGFLASAFAADNFSKRIVVFFVQSGINIPPNLLNTLSIITITFVLSYFTLVLGELVPKRLAMRNAERISLAMSGFVYVISKAFAPIVWFLTASTNIVLRLLRIDPNASGEDITEEEIRDMVDIGGEKGAIETDEMVFIKNVFDFNDKKVKEAMTHRTDVSFLWLGESTEQWEETLNASNHSVYPVCGKNSDTISGILYAKDYFRSPSKDRDTILSHCLKPALFVSDTERTDVLFRTMKKSKNHFAIVLDEYFGVSGIVTMHDLLEELVGDFENDAAIPDKPPEIQPLGERTWNISGTASLEDVSRTLNIPFDDGEHATFGGFIFSKLGFIPDDGSGGELELSGIKVSISEIKDRRLISAIVTRVD